MPGPTALGLATARTLDGMAEKWPCTAYPKLGPCPSPAKPIPPAVPGARGITKQITK